MSVIPPEVNNGISRIILGSVALKNPELVKEAVKEFGNIIAVGIDAKNGFAATEGWTESSDVYFTELAKRSKHKNFIGAVFLNNRRNKLCLFKIFFYINHLHTSTASQGGNKRSSSENCFSSR